MKAEEFKEQVINILKSEIKFDGHVELVIDSVPEQRQKLILEWIEECKKGNIKPEPCKNFKDLISFIYMSKTAMKHATNFS